MAPSPAAADARQTPLAERMRPRSIDEFIGQRHLVGDERLLGRMLQEGTLHSIILWGPPGSGKTTLARLLASAGNTPFAPLSAVTAGIADVRRIIAAADERRQHNGCATLLFIDEIHRFNKAQQDAFLPHVEKGTIVLVGATTENPSFEVIGPLLSRAKVLVLKRHSDAEIRAILEQALGDCERGLGAQQLQPADAALAMIADFSQGDARVALTTLEIAAGMVRDRQLTEAVVSEALQRKMPRYDKSGEEHYNLISALHKSLRSSDVDAALYWLARMLEAGEDPLYIARRMIRFAAEDIGMADPRALEITIAARDAFHCLGMPEGALALAQAAVYLATAPKSNAIYRAYDQAVAAARRTAAEGVPMHIRNAPTRLMKQLGYGKNYQYDHTSEGGISDQTCLPESLQGSVFYQPVRRGFEKVVAERLEVIKRRKQGSGS